MNLPDVPLLSMLRERMSWLNQRQDLLSQNVANADTPGYVARDLKPLNFDDAHARRHLRGGTLMTTNARHIAMSPSSAGDFEDQAVARRGSQPQRQRRVAGNGDDQGLRHPGPVPGRRQSVCQGHDA